MTHHVDHAEAVRAASMAASASLPPNEPERPEQSSPPPEVDPVERVRELEAELATERLNAQRPLIGARLGLPAILAERLHGSTVEELEADARALAERHHAWVATSAPPPRHLSPTQKAAQAPRRR